MKVLITTPPYNEIVPYFANRTKHNIKLVEINDKDKLLQLCMSAEYQMGFEWPHGGIWLIGENVPSVDVLEFPSLEEYEKRLNETRYDVVAFSLYRKDVPAVTGMIKTARNYGIKEIWTGNYGANTPGMEKLADRIILGDGIGPVKQLVEGKPLDYLRHPILMGKILNRFPVGYLYTAIGCRYKCKFCSTRNFIPNPLYVPIEEIKRVLDVYARNNVGSITILDETFLQDRQRSDQVIQELCKRNLPWHCTTRINLIKGRIKELHQKGLMSIYVGVESLTNNTLNTYTKGHTTEQVLDVFRELNDLGIRTTITYILGFEFDTIESILESIAIIKNDIKPFCTAFLILTPHTDSRITHLETLIVDNDHRHYDTQHLVWRHPHLTPEDIRQLLWLAHKETVHPRNVIKKKIVEKLEAMELRSSYLYSERAAGVYRNRLVETKL